MKQAKIPVWRIVGRSIRGVCKSAPTLASSAALPFSASLALELTRVKLFQPHEMLGIGSHAFWIVSAIPTAFFAYRCHVACLSTPGRVSEHSERVLRFIAWTLLGLLIYSASSLASPLTFNEEMEPVSDVAPLGFALYFALMLVTIVLVLRSSLILPITVTGDPGGPRRAWSLSRGRVWRLLWATTLPVLLVAPVSYILQRANLLTQFGHPVETLSTVEVVAALAIDVASRYVGVAFGAFALSHVYLFLRESSPAA